MLKTVGVVVSTHKPNVCEYAGDLIGKMRGRGIAVRVTDAQAGLLGDGLEVGDEDFVVSSDLLMVLGGDGTLLWTARKSAPKGTPILGVYISGFGFLTQTNYEEIGNHLDNLLEGRFETEQRMMLDARIFESGAGAPSVIVPCLNEVAIRRVTEPAVIDCHVAVSGVPLGTYRGDGLIVATPTGSTAYALSVFGPVIHPRMDAILLCGIAVHTLNVRPLVVPSEEVISVSFPDGPEFPDGIDVIVDGQIVHSVQRKDRLEIRRWEHAARFVQLSDATFYQRLRQKMHWGTD